MAKEKQINYTENDRAIVNALKGAEGPMTLAQINEATGLKLVAGNIVSAMRKGLITKDGEVDVVKEGTRKVYTYNFVSADAMVKADGKPFNYTDGEQEILKAASEIDSPFTLETLSKKLGRKVSSGSTNGLIKKGNITKGDQILVPCMTKSTVSVYAFAADIPVNEQQWELTRQPKVLDKSPSAVVVISYKDLKA